MSHNMLEHPSGLHITRFAGPIRDDGGPRTKYQITVPSGQYAQLDAEQWQALVQVCATIARIDANKPSAKRAQPSERALAARDEWLARQPNFPRSLTNPLIRESDE